MTIRGASLGLLLGTVMLGGCSKKGKLPPPPPDLQLPASAFAVQANKSPTQTELSITNNSGHDFTVYSVLVRYQLAGGLEDSSNDGGKSWKRGEVKTVRLNTPGTRIMKVQLNVTASDESHPWAAPGSGVRTYGPSNSEGYYRYSQVLNVP